jgi:hypothetical protein
LTTGGTVSDLLHAFRWFDVHVIRLRGPWEFELVDRDTANDARSKAAKRLGPATLSGPPKGKVKFPGATWGDLVLGGATGSGVTGDEDTGGHSEGSEGPPLRVRLKRRFGCPSNIEPGQRTWLVVESVGSVESVQLNGSVLATRISVEGEFRRDIAPWLAHRNELVIELVRPRAATDAASTDDDVRGYPLLGEARLEIETA